LPETHLRWELAALWVSRVCTRLLPGTEIASSGKEGEGDRSHVPMGALWHGYLCPSHFPFFTVVQRK
jgi:hypothetical protein